MSIFGFHRLVGNIVLCFDYTVIVILEKNPFQPIIVDNIEMNLPSQVFPPCEE